MYKTLTSLILAAATNCPLVPLQGTYMVQLITDESSINLYPTKINGRGCPAREHLTYAMSINAYSRQQLENLQLDHKEK